MRAALKLLSGAASAAFVLLVSIVQSQAMDRWSALSQVESGDNDSAVGAAGEVSRYQVKPELWRHYAAPRLSWQAATDALAVAQKIMKDRCAEFEHSYKRQPTDFEFYVLWNAPAQVGGPAKAVRQRAERFSNLVSRPEF
jgi:hypothetical protein